MAFGIGHGYGLAEIVGVSSDTALPWKMISQKSDSTDSRDSFHRLHDAIGVGVPLSWSRSVLPGSAESLSRKSRVVARKRAILVDRKRYNRKASLRRASVMPEKKTIERAQRAKRQGKAPSTQAGEFVREEMEHIREGKHGARSTKQAIAIGLSKARRAGVKLPPPESGTVPEKTRQQAKREYARTSEGKSRRTSPKRSRATTQALKRESRQAASKPALARQARTAARRHSAAERSAAAKKAARTRRTARK
jgi:hypothetical protein